MFLGKDVHMLLSPALSLSDDPAEYAADPAPSLHEFETLWKAWDTVTLSMISTGELLSKPIKLRKELVFYLGHIPTFLGQYQKFRSIGCIFESDNE
jgi:hypothetical protein